jgi:hypothetical protein
MAGMLSAGRKPYRPRAALSRPAASVPNGRCRFNLKNLRRKRRSLASLLVGIRFAPIRRLSCRSRWLRGNSSDSRETGDTAGSASLSPLTLGVYN